MKKLTLALLALVAIAPGAHALETEDALALVAMPLAVAAAADITGVPVDDLVDVVVAMNRAEVPPPQFVEVIRYTPVVLVEQREPLFVEYVTNVTDRGVAGTALARSMADRISAYGVREIDIVDPPIVTIVERDVWVPPVVQTRLGIEPLDPVALVAMPLAVVAVADVTGIPRDDFFRLVASLNRAAVPPAQFVEIVRYSPAVLVDPALHPQFVNFVTTSVDRGIHGDRLALAIVDRYEAWGIDGIDVVNPQIGIVEREEFIPPVVTRRVARVTGHPHGGPPGQLKREIGVQTGAEVVHGEHPSQRVAAGARTDRDRPATRRTEAPRQRGAARDDVRSERRERSATRESRPERPARKVQGNQRRGRGQGGSEARGRSDSPPAANRGGRRPPAAANRGGGRGAGGAAPGGNPNRGGGKGKNEGGE